MNIDITYSSLNIPFKSPFRHHLAVRHHTQSLLVRATSGGINGYGEGCPREYVTGESIHSATAFLDTIKPKVDGNITDLPSLRAFRSHHLEWIQKNPAAWCCLEMALLDLLARREGVSVENLLDLPELEGKFEYSAVLGNETEEVFRRKALSYMEAGFRSFKMKVGNDQQADARKIEFLADAVEGLKLRLDANNIWKDLDEGQSYLSRLAVQLTAIEEPFAAGQWSLMREFSDGSGLPVILDESYGFDTDLAALGEGPGEFLINLRVSRLGGILGALEFAERAASAGLGMVIGAQVGETSLLTRAGLTLANSLKGQYLALEGAFGTHLLEEDVVDPPLMFTDSPFLTPRGLLEEDEGWGLSQSGFRGKFY